MPSWTEYAAEARARGALAHELYMVLSTPGGDPAKVKETLPAHLAYQAELEARGALFLAGPVSDETGELMKGIGLIIYRAASIDDARALAEADPMHANGARSFVLRRWLINEGSLTFSVALSAQNVRFD
ncbi:YciI family protein [uncultured Marivita sp.]|uniref:YciI family protein n=1 Tax=uncultured Marivita sp. TaxID=888080 RepID=UPI0026263547|nr:YciI family protein [uncultured Marivita sp.]